ncbi:hypothetical protein [Pseudoalteromonas sp. GB56]
MMRCAKLLGLLALASSSALSGCNSTSNDEEFRPATLSEPSHQQVADIVAQLVGSQSVNLNTDVFMEKSSLVIEPPKIADANGNPIMGKQLEMPQRFMLLTDGKQCFIRHLNSEQVIPTPQLSCKE